MGMTLQPHPVPESFHFYLELCENSRKPCIFCAQFLKSNSSLRYQNPIFEILDLPLKFKVRDK